MIKKFSYGHYTFIFIIINIFSFNHSYIDQQSSNRPKNNCNLTKQRKKEKLPKNNITHNHTLSIDTLHPPPVCTCIHKGARSGAGARLQSYETCAPRGNIASAIRRRSAIRSIEERRQLTVIPAAAASPFHNFPLNRHSTRVFHPLSRVSTLHFASGCRTCGIMTQLRLDKSFTNVAK